MYTRLIFGVLGMALVLGCGGSGAIGAFGLSAHAGNDQEENRAAVRAFLAHLKQSRKVGDCTLTIEPVVVDGDICGYKSKVRGPKAGDVYEVNASTPAKTVLGMKIDRVEQKKMREASANGAFISVKLGDEGHSWVSSMGVAMGGQDDAVASLFGGGTSKLSIDFDQKAGVVRGLTACEVEMGTRTKDGRQEMGYKPKRILRCGDTSLIGPQEWYLCGPFYQRVPESRLDRKKRK